MRGRRPAGPAYAEKVRDCDDQTKRRLKVIMQTLCGELRVQEACAVLGVSPQRFHQLREEVMQSAALPLKPKPKGRPRQQPSSEQHQIEQLQKQLALAQAELRAAQARAEIALVLPRVVHTPTEGPMTTEETSAGKKKRHARHGRGGSLARGRARETPPPTM